MTTERAADRHQSGIVTHLFGHMSCYVYITGGIELLALGAVSDLRRQAKKMATAAISTNTMPTHRPPIPQFNADRGSLLPKTSMLAPGMKLINANIPPKNRLNSPGQPHNRMAAAVTVPKPAASYRP